MHEQHTIIAKQISEDEKHYTTKCSCGSVMDRPIESKEDLELLKAQHLETLKQKY